MDRLMKGVGITAIFMGLSFGINMFRMPEEFRNGVYNKITEYQTINYNGRKRLEYLAKRMKSQCKEVSEKCGEIQKCKKATIRYQNILTDNGLLPEEEVPWNHQEHTNTPGFPGM